MTTTRGNACSNQKRAQVGGMVGTCQHFAERIRFQKELMAFTLAGCKEMKMSQDSTISTGQQQRYRVTTGYKASNTDPFTVTIGEVFQVSEKFDTWNNNPQWIWIWCTDQHEKSGWVPKTAIHFNTDGKTGTTRYSYAATELTVVIGEELIATQEESGWVWCMNRRRESGWVPLENLALLA